ncbi:MAG: glycosyltransferase family 39 protein [Candidatus Omnitrophica bacterium]|nr:glycosyltransferase family 39 protein [Candidatus Omnitrophota bacterium]
MRGNVKKALKEVPLVTVTFEGTRKMTGESRRSDLWFILLSLLALSLSVTFLAIGRKFFLGNVESDYLGNFIPEAERFLRGEPLLVEFHPPLYAIAIGLVHHVFRDWFQTGLFLSWASSLASIVFIFLFFRYVSGDWEALGAIFGLVLSPTFLVHSATASSDLFFFALYSACFLLALLAVMRNAYRYWFLAGFLIGFALLTRVNAVCLFPLFLLPWISGLKRREAWIRFSALLVSFFFVLTIWTAYAWISHSPFFVQEAHLNLAMTYFSPGPDRMTHDAYLAVKGKFGNLLDVLGHDPLHLASVYARDFLFMIGRNMFLLVSPLVSFAALFGCSFFIRKSKKPVLYVYGMATLLHVLLINFKTYEDRFYIFLIPLFGASAGSFIEWVLEKKFASRKPRKVLAAFLLVLLLASAGVSFQKAYGELHPAFELELEESLPKVRALIPAGSILVARKSIVAYYTESERLYFPDLDTLQDLREYLAPFYSHQRDVFLYYGFYERTMRPQLSILGERKALDFLAPVASSERGRDWVLYRLKKR